MDYTRKLKIALTKARQLFVNLAYLQPINRIHAHFSRINFITALPTGIQTNLELSFILFKEYLQAILR